MLLISYFPVFLFLLYLLVCLLPSIISYPYNKHPLLHQAKLQTIILLLGWYPPHANISFSNSRSRKIVEAYSTLLFLATFQTPPKLSLAVALLSSTPVRNKGQKKSGGQPRREDTDRLASCNSHLHACKAAFLCTPPCRRMLQ